MYRFDKRDAHRAAFVHNLFYYRDYGRAGDVSLGGKTYHAMLIDDLATGDFRPAKGATNSAVTLLLDLNNNGKFERNGESFDVAKPFNIGGTTYEVAGLTASGGAFQIVKSSQTVEETKPRPILTAGAKALPFEAKTTGRRHDPLSAKLQGQAGDAGFLGDLVRTLPGGIADVTRAYEKYHDKDLKFWA